MTTWPTDVITRIAEADDFHITVFHPDMTTTGTLTWIWSVVVDGRLFCRAYSGIGGKWYRAAVAQRAGRVQTVGQTFDVAFVQITDPALNERIDKAYQTKYAGSPYMPPMIEPGPRAATVEVTPRQA